MAAGSPDKTINQEAERNKMSNTNQNGNIAFITSANRGLGLETAREHGKQGITVVLGSRDAKEGEAASETLRNEGIAEESLGIDFNNTQVQQPAYVYLAQQD